MKIFSHTILTLVSTIKTNNMIELLPSNLLIFLQKNPNKIFHFVK